MKRFETFKLMAGYLDRMCTSAQSPIEESTQWWEWGPFFCRKFINQTKSLELLLLQSDATYDISSVWALTRSLYEIHAAYYHLFIPCNDIEENILRFRLWELDSLRSLLAYKRDLVQDEVDQIVTILGNTEQHYVDSIKMLKVFNTLPTGIQEDLLKKANWRMTLANTKSRISYDQLIQNTRIKADHFLDMYDYSSMHVHPAYGGIRQNLGLQADEMEGMCYTATMQICFVTSFFIFDLKSRYQQASDEYNSIDSEHQKIIESFNTLGRNP